jgi:hypothetical protein
MGIVILSHLLINLNSIAVSGYLAYTLSQKMNDEDIDSSQYNFTLLMIMVSSILTSFIGKFVSNRIVSFKIHNSKVHLNQQSTSF